jgi:hypothetical protein
MKKIALIFVTVATLATALASPVEARGWRGGGWGWGPGIGLGIAAGSLAAGAYGAYGPYGPYGYGPRYYGYYGPRYASALLLRMVVRKTRGLLRVFSIRWLWRRSGQPDRSLARRGGSVRPPDRNKLARETSHFAVGSWAGPFIASDDCASHPQLGCRSL